MRRLAAAVLPLVLATCRGEGPPVRPLRVDDRDRLIALMAGIDSHLLEVQRGAGDPLEPEYIQKQLSGILEKFRHSRELDLPYPAFRSRANDAISSVEELARTPWTPADREERYASLRSLCGGCHRAFVPADPPASPRPDSRQTCGRCHETIYEEWKDTLHARAWIDPEYRMSAGNPPRLECRGCHAMEPILEREISTDVSYRPIYRRHNQEDGVSCISCHGLQGGFVAATRDLPEAPCRPRRDDRLRSPEFCGACHNPSHLVYDEWKRSTSGKTCVECHARREGKFSHRMRGVTEPGFVKDALGWSCDVVAGELRVALSNRSGHRLPAEVPNRFLRVKIRIGDLEEEVVFRRPMKQTVGAKDNRLWPDETRTLTRPLGAARSVSVEIRYQQSVFAQPHQWIVIGQWSKRL